MLATGWSRVVTVPREAKACAVFAVMWLVVLLTMGLTVTDEGGKIGVVVLLVLLSTAALCTALVAVMNQIRGAGLLMGVGIMLTVNSVLAGVAVIT